MAGPRQDRAGLPDAAEVGMVCGGGGEAYVFAPALVHIGVGGTVTWQPGSPCRQLCAAYHPVHDKPLRIPGAADPWEGPESRSGNLIHQFDVPGVYDYFGLYESFGQVGTVLVGRPEQGDQPGLAPPQRSLPTDARRALRDLNERTRQRLTPERQ